MKSRSGFTLIELLVVVSIIGTLSSIVFTAINNARLQAQLSATVSHVKELQKAIISYQLDVGQYPASCTVNNLGTCTAATDPFSNALGVPGWRGPYFKVYNLSHAWGGQIGWSNDSDFTGDGIPDPVIYIDDDRPGTGPLDNGGQVPLNYLLKLDSIFDDGNLTTGNARGNGLGGGNWPGVPGELEIIYRY